MFFHILKKIKIGDFTEIFLMIFVWLTGFIMDIMDYTPEIKSVCFPILKIMQYCFENRFLYNYFLLQGSNHRDTVFHFHWGMCILETCFASR